MPIALSPTGVLLLDESELAGLDARTTAGLRAAAAGGSGQLLAHLATAALDTPFPPGGAYWQNFARLYFTHLCHRADAVVLTPLDPPAEAELAAFAESAPPMPGAEYLKVETLQNLWREVDAAVLAEVRAGEGGVAAWLKSRQPVWNLVGRVTFHLAENKRNADKPFAFLATYTHRVSDQAKPQYLPLGWALQEYAGTRNRPALLSLLAPVQRAAQKSA
jgi:non-specific serine/threonine protein kinase